jgi:tetratricopeptide (TPR) repeat protein
MSSRFSGCVRGVMAWIALGCVAGASLSAAPTSEEIDRAFRELGDERAQVRDHASDVLVAAGMPIIPRLKQAAQDEDPEVRFRAEHILGRLSRGVFADTPADVAELADRYVLADESERHGILSELSRKGGYGYVVLMKLQEQEEDLWLKGQIGQILAAEVSALPQTAAVLLQQGDIEGAERLLATAADTGSELAIRAYAAFLLDQSKLDGKIAEWRGRFDKHEEGTVPRTLFFLYRAAGNLAEASAMAEKIGDPILSQTIAIERQDWKALAGLLANGEDSHLPDMRRLGLLAAAQRYSGDTAGAAKTISRILDYYKVTPGNYWPAALSLLLNDQFEEGLSLLVDEKRFVTAFELYTFAGRMDEAMALLERAKAEEHPDVPKLQAMTARMLWRLGETQRALALVNEVIAQAKPTNYIAYATLAEVEGEMARAMPNMAAQARVHAVQALRAAAVVEDRSRLFDSLFPGKGTTAFQWWIALIPPNQTGPERWQASMDIISKAMGDPLSQQQWEALAARVTALDEDQLDYTARMRRLELVIDALDEAGYKPEAERYFDRLRGVFAWAHTVPRELCVYLPKWQLRHEQWAAAASSCEICAAKLGNSPDLIWLRGLALHQAGDAKGDVLMAQARQRTLGEDSAMDALAEIMADEHHTDDAIEVRKQALRVGRPRDLPYYFMCRQLSLDLTDTQTAIAAGLWEQFTLVPLENQASLFADVAYVQMPQVAHHLRARALYQQGKVAEAMVHLRLLVKQAPRNVEFVIASVPELKKLGHDAEASELFNLVYAPLEALCAKYPSSGFYRNEAAWLAVRCGYQLDQALSLAQRAVELQPRETNNLDTLAEIYFRKGQREKAIALMKQCESIEPGQPRHHERRAEFEKGAR